MSNNLPTSISNGEKNIIAYDVKCNSCNTKTDFEPKTGITSITKSDDTITSITSITLLQLLQKQNNKLYLLLYHLQETPKSAKELELLTKIRLGTICNIIQNNSRGTGLLNDKLIEQTQENPNKYIVSEKGTNELKAIIKRDEIKRLEEQTQIAKKADVQSNIKHLQEFLERYYHSELLESVRLKQLSIQIDFKKILEFSSDFADFILDEPEEFLKSIEIGAEQFDLTLPQNFTFRLFNLPNSQKIRIRDIRSEHLGKLLLFKGVIRQKSDVRPQVTSARFECPSCGNIIPVLQLDNQFKEPRQCGCGRKGKFTLLSKELIDAQHIKIEEASDDLDGESQPKRINIFLKNDLVSPLNEKKTSPGSTVQVVGVVKEIPVIMRSGSKSTVLDLIIEANNIIPDEDNNSDIKITKQDIEKIKEVARDSNIYKKIIESIAPSIHGHTEIKKAVMVQLAGASKKKRKDKSERRGDIHILLIGDPGTGKSQLIRNIRQIAHKSRYVSGKGASGVGLTAGLVKDDLTNQWALEAGAMVLANKGICIIDELDKMSREDTSAMHESMEQQTVTISKANIQATLKSETAILAGANPKFGRFDPHSPIAEQIHLPVTLLNRFDLIFPIKDLPDEKKDAQFAEFILDNCDDLQREPPFHSEFLQKYFLYIRNNINPKLSVEAKKIIKEYYVSMRKSSTDMRLAINARQLEGLNRLAESYARIRLSETITAVDAQKAIDLLHGCMKKIAFDEETGTFDIDKISNDIDSKSQIKISEVKRLINETEQKFGKTIPVEPVQELAKIKGIDEDSFNQVITQLKRAGDIFEPKHGFIQKI